MRYPDLDIDLVRAFVAVADAGGFTAAAEVVHRSQSAVSQKVLRLEELLGRRLIERTSRSLKFTRDGEQLLGMARRILELNEYAVRSLLDPPAAGTLRLGISDDFIPRQLPSLLARFRRLNPKVHLELMNGLGCQLLDAYDAGRLDAVIASKDSPMDTGRRDPRGKVIWREPLVWMSADGAEPDVRQSRGEPIPLVLMPEACPYRQITIGAMKSMRRDWYAACTATSLMGVQAAVAAGIGISILGRSFVQPGLKVLRSSETWPPLPMAEIVAIGEESGASALVRPLVSFLTDNLSTPMEAVTA